MADRFLAQDCSDQVLKCVKDSNLHFVVKETPFSLYITIRKKFVTENNSNNLEPKENDQVQTLEESLISLQTEHDALDQENSDIRTRYEEMKVINGELSEKLSQAKTELCDWMSSYSSVEKANEETLEEIEVLKGANKRFIEDNSRHKTESKSLKKDLKQKEKEVFELETKIEKLEGKEKKSREEKLEQNNNSSDEKTVVILSKPQPTISTLSSLATASDSSTTVSKVSAYNIKTWNSFENLKDSKSRESKLETMENDSSLSDLKRSKISCINYREAFQDFLRNFKDKPTEPAKYQSVAKLMMQKKYNMFHIDLKDMRKFNPNLAGFMKANCRDLMDEIKGQIQV